MINFEGAQVIWNISEKRPATGDELATLINKGWLLMNFVSRSDSGEVWIDLDDIAEGKYEIRNKPKLCLDCGHPVEYKVVAGCLDHPVIR